MSDLMGNFSDNVVDKARSVKLADIKPHESDETVWFVKSMRTGKWERVQFVGDDWVTCSCQHGSNRGGQAACYHAAAAVLIKDNATYLESLLDEEDENKS